MTTSLCACSETASATWMAPPVRRPGGNPVTALPGLTPRLWFKTDGPVLDTVEPASTAKACAVPTREVVCTTAGRAVLVGTTDVSGVNPVPQAAAASAQARREVRRDFGGQLDRTMVVRLLSADTRRRQKGFAEASASGQPRAGDARETNEAVIAGRPKFAISSTSS
jgi:hypothetical protein